MEPKHASKILIDSHANNMSVTDASICPTHNYIQREDIDNTSECSVDDPQYRHLHTHHVNNNNLGTRSINIRAAVIHVIGDFIQSIGVFTSAVIIKFFVSTITDYAKVFQCCLTQFVFRSTLISSPKRKRPIQYAHFYFQLL